MRKRFVSFGLLLLVYPAFSQLSVPSRRAPNVAPENDLTIQKKLPDDLRGLTLPQPVPLPGLGAPEQQTRPRMGAKRVGITRTAPPNLLRSGRVSRSSAGRQVWAVRLQSAGAGEIRLHFRSFNVDAGQVWLIAAGDPNRPQGVAGPYTGRGVFGDGDFWSAAIASETVAILYVPPAGSEVPAEPPFQVESIGHRWMEAAPEIGPQAQAGGFITTTAAAACNLDVSCYPEYHDIASAVGRYTFVADDGSGVYLCSGALVNTTSGALTPYFLTAHHCVSSESEARSVQVLFNYQTSSCNGDVPFLSGLPSVLGAGYIAGAPFGTGDYAFLQLTGAPSGVLFAGWTTEAPELSAPLTGIHHPHGSWKRIAFGSRIGDSNASIGGQTLPSRFYYQVRWNDGATEPGSSGSPLFNAKQQIVGTLTSGPVIPANLTACDVSPLAGYGRFTNEFELIKDFLDDDPSRPLHARPTPLSFSVVNGNGSLAQNLIVTSVRPDPIVFTIQADQPWVKFPESGTVSLSAPASLAVQVDPQAFPDAGTFNARLTVVADGIAPLRVPVQVVANKATAQVSLSATPNPVVDRPADFQGYNFYFKLTLTETSGSTARLKTLKFDDVDASSAIDSIFGVTTLGPLAVLTSPTLSFRSKPHDALVELGGTDFITGEPFTSLLTLPFVAAPPPAPVVLTSLPATVRRNPDLDAECPWVSYLQLADQHKTRVEITRFLAGAEDLSPQIEKYFGSTHLAPDGMLRARMCWQTLQVPTTMEFEIDGTDEAGAAVTAKATASFGGIPQNPDSLTVTPDSVALSASRNRAQVSITVKSTATAWSAVLFYPGKGGWATVNPSSGTGSTRLIISASDTGLADGTYQAVLSILAVDAVPQIVNIPVTFQLGN